MIPGVKNDWKTTPVTKQKKDNGSTAALAERWAAQKLWSEGQN